MTIIQSVDCPCCGKELYHKTENERIGPSLDQDSKGLFMTCEHCTKRINLEEIQTAEGNPAEYVVSKSQSCK